MSLDLLELGFDVFDIGSLAFVKRDISIDLLHLSTLLGSFFTVTGFFGTITGHKKEDTYKDSFETNPKGKIVNAFVEDEPTGKPSSVKENTPPGTDKPGNEFGNAVEERIVLLFGK